MTTPEVMLSEQTLDGLARVYGDADATNMCVLQGVSVWATRHSAARFAARNSGMGATQTTQHACLQGKQRDGSDGTRTRDLRRDRPVRGSRRLTTIDAESLYSCGFAGLSRFDSAWLSEADFGRLLPVCCPEWMLIFGSDPRRCQEDRLGDDHSGEMEGLLDL